MNYNKKEVRERFRDLFKYSLDFIYVHDLKGNFLDANEVALDALGYKRSEINELSFIKLLGSQDQLVKALNYAKEIVENGRQSKRSEYKLKTKDGSFIYVETYAVPLRKDDKVYALLGIGTDVTSKKKAKMDLKESEERFRNLFESSPFSIVILNSKGIIVDCNPTTESILGYNKSDLVGSHFKELPLIQDKDLKKLFNLFSKIINGIHIHRIDVQLKKKDGNLIWINLQGSIIEVENQPFLQVIVHDISKRKEVELLINQKLKKLKELDITRKNLMIRISHELKTPLMLISGGIEYLIELEKESFSANALNVFETIQRASKRLGRLVEDLIDSTKFDYKKVKLNPEKIDIAILVKNTVKEMRYLFEQRNLDVKFNISDNPIMNLDSLRIKQVITNLLLNSIKNTPPKGSIQINLEKCGKFVVLCVIDSGIGIKDNEMDKLFTRFGKIERSGENTESIDISGTGLGLFISKAIIELHNGEILAESEGRNKGAKFTVKLPLN
ncbi:MAG: PAS domain S-box protein [Candidatus Lokiarchaeota archaeon]|nr:PAS domain S-box protein [Candidatus Lokiarchaeota archaeon]MBD3199751.1 PAS domain S-box protein [Candidatus Lokiarchaeota archaeon]